MFDYAPATKVAMMQFMGLGNRIRDRLDEIGQSQAALARSIGVSPQAISKLVVGGTAETPKLHMIARFLETTPEYLSGETDDPAPTALADKQLPFRGYPDQAPANDPDVVELPQIDLKYGMGGTFVDGPVGEERRLFSRAWLRQFTRTPPEDLFWAVGDGDSMEPTIRSGEVILIDRSQQTTLTGDGIWACAWGDIGMVKRLRPLPDGTVEIHSDNQFVPPATAADGEIHLIGRVVAVIRKL